MARPFKYTADQLKQLFIDYKEYRANQFDVRYESIKSGEKAGETYGVKLPKVLTIASFCHFIGVTEKSFYNWLNDDNDTIEKELLQFVTCVQEEIKDFQLSGATNGIYNANIVARMNGLNETIQVDQTSQPAINISIGSDIMNLSKR